MTQYAILPEQARFLDYGFVNEHHWNTSRLFRVSPDLTADLAAAAFLVVANRHDGLRCGLRKDSRTEWGFQIPPLDGLELTPIDLRDLPEAERAKTLTEYCTALQASLSLTKPPLFRLGYFILSDTEYRILLTVHHFVIDLVSWHLIISEFQLACKILLQGRSVKGCLPTLGTSARDFSYWLRDLSGSGALNGYIPLWQQIGRPGEPIPVDHEAENTLETQDSVMAELDPETTARLVDDFLAEHTAGMQEVILTAAVSTLHGSGRERSMQALLIGHGRTGLPGQPHLDRTVGWLTAAYPVTVKLDTRQCLASQLENTRKVFQKIPHDGTSFGVLRYMSPDPWVREELAALGTPQIMINYLGELPGKTRTGVLAPADEPNGSTSALTGSRVHVHTIAGYVTNGVLHLEWYYSRNQFRTSTIEGYLEELLGRIRFVIGPSQQ